MPQLLSFIVPVNARGLRWACRELYAADRTHALSPLASRADEMDCVAVFEECFIPWDDVFTYAHGELPREPLPSTWLFEGSLRYDSVTRAVAKTRFILGVAHLFAESAKIGGFVNVQQKLADIVDYLRTLEAFALAAVHNAQREPETGLWAPDLRMVDTAVRWFGEHYQIMLRHLMDLGGSRHITQPHQATLDALGPAAESYFRGSASSSRENVSLYALAWDLVGSNWGVRQDLYERFHFGDSTLGKLRAYAMYDKTEAVEMVQRILEVPATVERPFPLPKPGQQKG